MKLVSRGIIFPSDCCPSSSIDKASPITIHLSDCKRMFLANVYEIEKEEMRNRCHGHSPPSQPSAPQPVLPVLDTQVTSTPTQLNEFMARTEKARAYAPSLKKVEEEDRHV